METGRKISPNPADWRCDETGVTENLWLNLSTGHIGSGRQVRAAPPLLGMQDALTACKRLLVGLHDTPWEHAFGALAVLVQGTMLIAQLAYPQQACILQAFVAKS